MSRYVFTDDMREISGFGGGYEGGCRAMVVAGLEWWDEHPKADPKVSSFRGIYGLTRENNDDATALVSAMVAGADRYDPKGGATGAMVQACIAHVFRVRHVGWESYAEEMRQLLREERGS